ncbi:MAG: permease-like cell division protein FtsX [Actinomycetota bacterium]
MARKTNYYFREATTGFKRNGLVVFAAISTVFIALFLLGLTLLIRQEVDLIIERTGGKVEIAIFLRDDISDAQQSNLQDQITGMPEVDEVRYESKTDAFQRAQELFKDEPEILENLTEESLPASFRVKLVDPETDFEVIGARLAGQPGVEQIKDQRELLKKLFSFTAIFRTGILIVAILMLVSAGLLIANTVRVGLYARRKEIGIMKLVGATNWFIRLPFLIEGILAALIGAFLAILVLAIMQIVFVEPLRGNLLDLPVVSMGHLISIIPLLLVAGLVVAVAASFAGMRRFLDI